MLRVTDQNTWVDPEGKDFVTLIKCLEVYPADDLEVYPVAKDLSENSVKILQPIDDVELAN